MTAYQELEAIHRRIKALDEARGMLHWDMAVLMPENGMAARTEQLAALTRTIHQMKTNPRIGELLDEAGDSLDTWQRSNLREMRRLWIHATAVDGSLVEAMTRACTTCEMVWRRARVENDFGSVVDPLKEVLARVREIASAKAEQLGVSSYEALLDSYEPGGRTERIDQVFGELAETLPGILDQALSVQGQRGEGCLPVGDFSAERQRALAVELMTRLGFDFDAGRLDISLHPFCGGVPGDIRITTRYDESDFTRGLMGVLHETGHALYEMGLPEDWRWQPAGDARGMVLHESQSLLVEMQVCRSREFLEFAAPLMCDALSGTGDGWDPDNLHRRCLRVGRGFIRVDADEVTYPLHVMLRYRLERALVEGDLAVPDIPDAWNDAMEEFLDVRPPDDRLGCLQDIHWYDGAWGYFPTYTLGALAAAQLFAALRNQIPDIRREISRGEFEPLVSWLREHVHARASSVSTDNLLEAATGEPLNTTAFKEHLLSRYCR